MIRGMLRSDVSMRKHTSWRAGGVAKKLYQPADLADLQLFLRQQPLDEQLYVVGLGSNLLVRDGGFNGTIILLHGALTQLSLEDNGDVYVQAGVPGAKLARFAALHHRQGAEFFAGIPGTMGGMLAMNAGCYGSETWDKVLKVQTINRAGELHIRTSTDYEIAYRHVKSQRSIEEIFVAAWLQFADGDADVARLAIKELLNKRISSQPLNLPNAGSVFRNPPGDFAARLIEQSGLKGKRLGGAQVSEKHANFIVNVDNASAADIENLIHEVQHTVAARTGVSLMCEVKIVGEQ